jgi:hypothetical protein
LEDLIREWAIRFALLIDAATTVFIVVATVEAIYRALSVFFAPGARGERAHPVRWRLGHRDITRDLERIATIETLLRPLVRRIAPELLAIRGVSTTIAAGLIGHAGNPRNIREALMSFPFRLFPHM